MLKIPVDLLQGHYRNSDAVDLEILCIVGDKAALPGTARHPTGPEWGPKESRCAALHKVKLTLLSRPFVPRNKVEQASYQPGVSIRTEWRVYTLAGVR